MPKPIEVLNLIMRKEHALRILHGEKNVEIRSMSPHYHDRLSDKDVVDFYHQHKNDAEIAVEFVPNGLLQDTRPVKTIHFHDYSNSWYMDVEVLGWVIPFAARYSNPDKDDYTFSYSFLQDVYDFHELDEFVSDIESKSKDDYRPAFYGFAIKRVISTNLE